VEAGSESDAAKRDGRKLAGGERVGLWDTAFDREPWVASFERCAAIHWSCGFAAFDWHCRVATFDGKYLGSVNWNAAVDLAIVQSRQFVLWPVLLEWE
jgi:hypothetical protein